MSEFGVFGEPAAQGALVVAVVRRQATVMHHDVGLVNISWESKRVPIGFLLSMCVLLEWMSWYVMSVVVV